MGEHGCLRPVKGFTVGVSAPKAARIIEGDEIIVNHITSLRTALALAIVSLPLGVAARQPAPATASSEANSEDARLNAFFDKEYADELLLSPQLATRLGMKEGRDKLDDISDVGQQRMLDWRRGSVQRMKQQFDRSKLSPEGQVNYDIWAMELDRAELAHRYRLYRPPFYSTLYSIHDRLPDFLINNHSVTEPADLAAYAARIRAIPGVLDTAIAQMREAARIGCAPRSSRSSGSLPAATT